MDGQNGWAVQGDEDESAEVTNEAAAGGAWAAKVFVGSFGSNLLPSLSEPGVAAKELTLDAPDQRMRLVFEAAVKMPVGGEGEYALQTIDAQADVASSLVLFTFTGDIYVDFLNTGRNWLPDQWSDVRVETLLDQSGCPATARVFIDDQPVGDRAELTDVTQIDGWQFIGRSP